MSARLFFECIVKAAGIFFIAVLAHELTHIVLGGSPFGICFGVCPLPSDRIALASAVYFPHQISDLAKSEYFPNISFWSTLLFLMWLEAREVYYEKCWSTKSRKAEAK